MTHDMKIQNSKLLVIATIHTHIGPQKIRSLLLGCIIECAMSGEVFFLFQSVCACRIQRAVLAGLSHNYGVRYGGAPRRWARCCPRGSIYLAMLAQFHFHPLEMEMEMEMESFFKYILIC